MRNSGTGGYLLSKSLESTNQLSQLPETCSRDVTNFSAITFIVCKIDYLA